MKLKLIFSYDGSKFQGSQTQPHQNGVEDALALALSHVGIFTKIISSSRTDKDVHANNQVACVEAGEHFKDLNHLTSLINRHAHPYIHIKNITRANDSFHPRYDAKARSYRYIISHDKFSVFLSDYQVFTPKIDIKKANLLLKNFIGEHDFSLFMKTGSDTKSPIRSVYKAFCYEYKNKTIIVFKANGFLRAQVRLMVACVLKALKTTNGEELLKAQINTTAPLTRIPAPPQGLYLNRVFY
ncbi:tRNA pseudouridine(38-40) synthase TruA [Campylobacter suis]|uniref:tRNA pseudouridine synthase A n=1 Tax=Campylobacter suis TaxID=2790657 RepID=A0ABM8Q1P3_9BACT|nr:tRNA pseudouridine(38-40) synthase TruA [Campylobacter suis]CAD7286761.1 tRNA pseudouridine synthase A [Campylobacter suis]